MPLTDRHKTNSHGTSDDVRLRSWSKAASALPGVVGASIAGEDEVSTGVGGAGRDTWAMIPLPHIQLPEQEGPAASTPPRLLAYRRRTGCNAILGVDPTAVGQIAGGGVRSRADTQSRIRIPARSCVYTAYDTR